MFDNVLPEKPRRMAFHEINRGKLGEEVQKLFEDAQDISAEREVKTEVTLKITVFPPDPKEEHLGSVAFKCFLKQPPIESRKFETLLKDGRIIKDAEDPQRLLNLDMFDADNPGNSIPLKKQSNE